MPLPEQEGFSLTTLVTGAQMLFVAAVVGLQLWWSPWWLARYRFGPMEWLWRSLTYGRWQPVK